MRGGGERATEYLSWFPLFEGCIDRIVSDEPQEVLDTLTICQKLHAFVGIRPIPELEPMEKHPNPPRGLTRIAEVNLQARNIGVHELDVVEGQSDRAGEPISMPLKQLGQERRVISGVVILLD